MKKVLCFIGREHHGKRLNGILSALSKKEFEVSRVIADNSLNIDPTATNLIPAGLPFKHALDYFDPKFLPTVNEIVRNALQALAPTTFEQDLFNFVDPFWIVSSIREFAEDIVGFASLLQKEAPSVVMVLHESNAWGKLLAYLCHELSIPCIAFQEGLLRHRDQKTQGKQSLAADYSSKLCVWSEGSRLAYLDSGITDSKIEVTGMAHLDPFIEKWKTASKEQHKYLFGFNPNKPLITFGMPQLGRFEGDPNVNITQLANWASNNLMQVAIRPHPFEGEALLSQLRNGLKQHPTVRLVTEGETVDLLACSDLVLTQHSTVGVEAMAMGTPVAELSLSNAFILESLSDQGVAISIKSDELDKIKKMLSKELVVSPAVLNDWKNVNLGPLDGRSTERVVEAINEL